MPNILSETIDMLTTGDQVNNVEKFCKENNLDSDVKVEKALKTAKFNLKWAEQNLPIIKSYLQKMSVTRNSAPAHTVSFFIVLSTAFIFIFN